MTLSYFCIALLLVQYVACRNILESGKKGWPASLKPGCLPPDANTSTIKNTDLFCPGDLGYGCYKIPVVMKTSKNTLLAMIEARKFSCDDHGYIDLLVRRSFDNGKTWAAPQLMYTNSTETEWTTVGDGNWVEDTSTGIIWVLFTYNNSRLFLANSPDEGETWSTAVDVSASLRKAGGAGTGHAGGIELSAGPHKGRLLIPVYSGGPYLVYSDDHGQTWNMGGYVPGEKYSHGSSAGEWAVAETGFYGEDGTPILLASVRNSPNIPEGITGKGYRLQSISRDGGVTWGESWEVKELPEPIRGCEGGLLWHPVTKKLYFSHPDPDLDLFRNKLQIWSSDNMGSTWNRHAVVWSKAAGYSSMALTEDGKIGVFYDRNNHTMAIFEAQSVSWTTIDP